MEKYGRASQVTGDNIIRRMRFACWITKDKNAQSEHVIRIAFTHKNGYATYITFKRTLPVLLIFSFTISCVKISQMMPCVCRQDDTRGPQIAGFQPLREVKLQRRYDACFGWSSAVSCVEVTPEFVTLTGEIQ